MHRIPLPLPMDGKRHLDELDTCNAALASMGTMAHLDLLARRGVLVREVTEGTATCVTAGSRPVSEG